MTSPDCSDHQPVLPKHVPVDKSTILVKNSTPNVLKPPPLYPMVAKNTPRSLQSTKISAPKIKLPECPPPPLNGPPKATMCKLLAPKPKLPGWVISTPRISHAQKIENLGFVTFGPPATPRQPANQPNEVVKKIKDFERKKNQPDFERKNPNELIKRKFLKDENGILRLILEIDKGVVKSTRKLKRKKISSENVKNEIGRGENCENFDRNLKKGNLDEKEEVDLTDRQGNEKFLSKDLLNFFENCDMGRSAQEGVKTYTGNENRKLTKASNTNVSQRMQIFEERSKKENRGTICIEKDTNIGIGIEMKRSSEFSVIKSSQKLSKLRQVDKLHRVSPVGKITRKKTIFNSILSQGKFQLTKGNIEGTSPLKHGQD